MMRRAFFCAAMTAATAMFAHPGQGQTPDATVPPPFADIPNVTISHYDVAGRSAAAVRRSINAARPTDVNDGKRVDGLAQWSFRWRWRDDGSGTCRVTPEDVSFTATVTIPRLADPAPPAALRRRFDGYIQSLLAHEEGHLRHPWERRGEIVDAMNAAGCDGADAAAKAVVERMRARDVAYDAATDHGRRTILPFG